MTPADRSPPKPKSVPKRARSAPRTTARLAAAQALYEMEVSGKSGHEVVPDFVDRRFAGLIEGGDMAPADPHFFERLVLGVAGETPTLDRMLADRSEEHTSELQSLMRISYAVFCLKKTKKNQH